MLKSLFVVSTFFIAFSAMSADIQCAYLPNKKGKVTKKLIPVSKDAKNLADQLGVKTCNSERFEVLAEKNGGMKTRTATPEERKTYLLSGTEDIKL